MSNDVRVMYSLQGFQKFRNRIYLMILTLKFPKHLYIFFFFFFNGTSKISHIPIKIFSNLFYSVALCLLVSINENENELGLYTLKVPEMLVTPNFIALPSLNSWIFSGLWLRIKPTSNPCNLYFLETTHIFPISRCHRSLTRIWGVSACWYLYFYSYVFLVFIC